MVGASNDERPVVARKNIAQPGPKPLESKRLIRYVNQMQRCWLTTNGFFRCGLTVAAVVRSGLGALIESGYPPTCIRCGGDGVDGMDLCRGCLLDLPGIGSACGCCALPLPAGAAQGSRCGACQRRPPAFDRCIAVFRYQDSVRRLIGDLKFRGQLNRGRLFGQLLGDAIRSRSAAPLPDLIVPVPLHPARLRERGFNQALEIARVVGRRLGIAVDAHTAIRTLAKPPQISLTRVQRLDNVRGVFSLRRPLAAVHVAIVDDVVTTGATVGELARVLRQQGAEWVEVWAVARTP